MSLYTFTRLTHLPEYIYVAIVAILLMCMSATGVHAEGTGFTTPANGAITQLADDTPLTDGELNVMLQKIQANALAMRMYESIMKERAVITRSDRSKILAILVQEESRRDIVTHGMQGRIN